jgi:transposase
MIRDRGYSGSVVQLRRSVARLRPHNREAFLQLHAFAGEQAQVDWAHFGHVMVGRAKRALSCFVATLSYSRALYLEFFFDQTTENFLRGHVHAFQAWSGHPLQRSPARYTTEALQRTSPIVREALVAPRPIAGVSEKNVPE